MIGDGLSNKVEKRLVLKRCYFPSGENATLENVIGAIFDNVKHHVDRKYPIDFFRTYQITYIKPAPRGHSGYIIGISVNDSQATGIINPNSSTEIISIDEFSPPNDGEWLESEIILYVRGNNVLACNLGNRDSSVCDLIYDVARRNEFIRKDARFFLSDVPNKTTAEEINRVGVKHIDLNITSYLGSMAYLEAPGALGEFFKSIFAPTKSTDDIAKSANSTGRVILKRGKLDKEAFDVDQWLTNAGLQLYSDKDEFSDYKIILENGKEIGPTELRVGKKVKINRRSNFYDRAHAEILLLDYFKELDGSSDLA